MTLQELDESLKGQIPFDAECANCNKSFRPNDYVEIVDNVLVHEEDCNGKADALRQPASS